MVTFNSETANRVDDMRVDGGLVYTPETLRREPRAFTDSGYDDLETIGEYICNAPQAELPGLEAALRCMLHADASPAHVIVHLLRATARIREWLHSSVMAVQSDAITGVHSQNNIWRLEFSGPVGNPGRAAVHFVEAVDAQDAIDVAASLRTTATGVRLVGIRQADTGDLEEVITLADADGSLWD
jgi:hypothetical protein